MKLTLIDEERPFEVRWWSGTVEQYEVCTRYRVEDPPPGLSGGEISVAVGWRAAFGANRRRILVFRDLQTVLIELVGTDDWEESRDTAWLLKLPGGRRDVSRREDVPAEFDGFDIDRCNEWIAGPSARSGYAARVHETDHESMVRLAMIREQHRKRRSPDVREEAPEPAGQPESTLVGESHVSTAAASVVRALASYSREYVEEHLFPSIARYTGHLVETREQACNAVASPVASLSVLLGYYAFARQGAERAGYNEACASVLQPYLDGGSALFWSDFPDWTTFHAEFVTRCDGLRIAQNERINPGLIRDVYGLAAGTPDTGVLHHWASRIGETNRVAGVFGELVDVHGIGEKIAAFICRDVVFLAGLEEPLPSEECRYLQPIDIWIGRIVEFLNPDLTFKKDPFAALAEYLAAACSTTGVSGVSFNQGGWYFGSQVAGSARRLTELLTDLAGGGGLGPRRRSGRLIVVACGKRKIWDDQPDHGACPARDAYRGQFFTVNRRYAERFAPDDWMILSARFGFVRPDTPITDYNATFKEGSAELIGPDQLRVSAAQLGVTEYDEIEVLGGREYVGRLEDAVRSHPVKVLKPYADCSGIGVMMGKATRAVELGAPMNRLPDQSDSSVAAAGDSSPGSNAGGGQSQQTLEQEFNTAMLDVFRRAGEECGYHATRFVQMVHELGGLETAQRLLQKPDQPEGLTTLWERGRLDLSVEALVLRLGFLPLFTDEEQRVARDRLARLGYTL